MAQDIQGVLFDLDGTLLDTHDLLLETFRYATRKVLGERIPDGRLMAKVGQPLVTQMWDFTDDEAVHDELVEVYREYNAAIHDDMVRLFPGTREALAALHEAGFPLGVVTSKRHEVALHGLGCFGLGGPVRVRHRLGRLAHAQARSRPGRPRLRPHGETASELPVRG